MDDRRSKAPAEKVVIWSTSSLLAFVLGVGSSFVLWMALRGAGQSAATSVAIAGLGLGLVLIGCAAPRALTRIFLIVFAVALVLGFVLGGPSFSHLTA